MFIYHAHVKALKHQYQHHPRIVRSAICSPSTENFSYSPKTNIILPDLPQNFSNSKNLSPRPLNQTSTMQFINIPTMLVAFSTGMLTPVSGSSLSTDPTAGILAPAEWVIPNINGANVTFYGTATEVSAQLQALHAAWMPLNTTNIPNKIVETAVRTSQHLCDINMLDCFFLSFK